MEKQLMKFAVGEEFPLTNCRGLQGFFMEYNEDNALCLVVTFPRFTPAEQETIIKGDARIGLFKYDNVIYFACKFGKIDGDSAYNVHRYEHPERITMGEPEDGQGILLNIFAVDSANNKLVGMRTASMGTRWTRTLRTMIEEQKQQPMSMEEWAGKVAIAHNRWTAKDLLKNSVVTYKLGTLEG